MNTFTVQGSSTSGIEASLADQIFRSVPMQVGRAVVLGCSLASSSVTTPVASTAGPAHALVKKSYTFSPQSSELETKSARSDLSSFLSQGQPDPGLWVETISSGAWVQSASDRIHFLAAKPDGWKGEGSVAPSYQIVSNAIDLIQKLRSEGCRTEPMIGADEDGELIFYWKSTDAVASISVVGDGTYSLVVKSDGGNLSVEDCRTSDPLPRELVRTFDIFHSKEA